MDDDMIRGMEENTGCFYWGLRSADILNVDTLAASGLQVLKCCARKSATNTPPNSGYKRPTNYNKLKNASQQICAGLHNVMTLTLKNSVAHL